MENDDNMNVSITVNGDLDVTEAYTIDDLDLDKYIINITKDDAFRWNLDTGSSYDNSFGIIPEAAHPTVYTSYEQRALHEKYPALQKAWEDYLNMYNLTQGDPPIVD
jgi:hypothetical protein